MVHEDRLFIYGPAIVIIFEDNRPISRRFEFPVMRVAVLLPQAQMTEDARDHVGFMDELNASASLHVRIGGN